MGQRGLHDEADARALQQQPQRDEHADGDRHHEDAQRRIVRAPEGEERLLEDRGRRVGQRILAPDQLDDLLDQIGEAEGEQELRDVTVAMDMPEAETLDHRTEETNQKGRQDHRQPEARHRTDRVGQIGAEHVEARMGEIEHSHHREDEGQSARQHEQQKAVQ